MKSVKCSLWIVSFLILILLVAQFNSLRKSFIVLMTIPLGLIGVVVGLLLDKGLAYRCDCSRERLDELRERGILDDALLVVTSDHGENLAEHGDDAIAKHFGHWSTSLRIPLVVADTRVETGGVRDVEVPWDDVERMDDADLINLLCAHLPLEPDDKQALIETIGLGDRADLMQGLMAMSSVSGVDQAQQRH